MAIKFPLAVVITGQDVGLESALSRTNQRLRATAQLATSIGRGLTYGVTLPLLGVGAAAVRTGTEVQTNILRVKAAAQLSEQQAAALHEQARGYSDLGVGVKDATAGMVAYAKAGLDVQAINATMRPTILLAKSANMEFERTAEGLVNVMAGYRKPFSEAGQVVDELAFAAEATTNDVGDLFEALRYAGPVAAGLNQTFEDTVAILAVMGQNGFKATLGGTALRGALADLTNTTPQAAARLKALGVEPAMWRTSTGSLKSMVEIVELLEEHAITADDAMAIFGDRGGPALVALLGAGSGAVRRLSRELENSGGSAMKKYTTVTSGAAGAQDRLMASLQNLADSLAQGGVLDAFSSGVRTIDGWVKAFDRLSPRTKENIVLAAGLAAAVGPVVLVVGQVIQGVLTLSAAYKTLAAAQALAGTTAAAATPKVAALGTAANAGGAAGLARFFGPAAFLALTAGAGTPEQNTAASSRSDRLRGLLTDLASEAGEDPDKGRGWNFGGGFEVRRIQELLGRGFGSSPEFREKHSRVLVEFKGTPAGTRVTAQTGAENLDLDVGYAMASP